MTSNQIGSRRQKASMAFDRTRAALSAVCIVLLCPGLAAAARYVASTDLHNQSCKCSGGPTTVYRQETLVVSRLYRPLKGQQQQPVALAGLDLTALVVLIEHFVFACGYDCAVLMWSYLPAGRKLQQVFSQASGTGRFVDTMTSGSFNLSFHCGSLSFQCAAVGQLKFQKLLVSPLHLYSS